MTWYSTALVGVATGNKCHNGMGPHIYYSALQVLKNTISTLIGASTVISTRPPFSKIYLGDKKKNSSILCYDIVDFIEWI